MSHGSRKALIIGAGGHASVVIEVARAGGFEPVAALDHGRPGSICNGVEVAGGDELAEQFLSQGVTNAILAIGDNRLRARIGRHLSGLGFCLPIIVHPTAVISPSASIGAGTVIMPLAVVNARSQIGRMVVLNTGAVIEHDCSIGDGAHVAPRSVLGGGVSIGNCVLIGLGTVIRPQATVADFAVVGAGSTVVKDIEANATVMGSPAAVRKEK